MRAFDWESTACKMVRAVKRKPDELGYDLATGVSLKAMTRTDIKLMNAEFEKQLAERVIKVCCVCLVSSCPPCSWCKATRLKRPVLLSRAEKAAVPGVSDVECPQTKAKCM